MATQRKTYTRIGPLGQKVLLLLEAGIVLSLTTRPDMYFKVVKTAAKEWRKINSRSLHDAVKCLYQSQLVQCEKNNDGSISLILSKEGKQKFLRYQLDAMTISTPAHWDGLWRIVLFDIPEKFKQGRYALTGKLKGLGFYPMQKSVFIYPYDCKNEIDFIIEVFDLRPFVRFMVVKEVDIHLDLKRRFHLK